MAGSEVKEFFTVQLFLLVPPLIPPLNLCFNWDDPGRGKFDQGRTRTLKTKNMRLRRNGGGEIFLLTRTPGTVEAATGALFCTLQFL